MGRFKAGDRVKILAGHPYWLGNDNVGVETEGVYVTKEDRGRRGKHIVKVEEVGGGAVTELSFKGRELEPLVAAEWVPKVGDRVRRVRHTGTISNCRIGHETTITRLLSHGRGFWYEGEDGSEQNSSRLDDWEVISSFTIEAGKFYRTRDGRKVGPMRHSNRASFEEGANGESYPYYADGYTYTDAGRCHWNPKEDHRSDLVAEWVDEPAVAPTATTNEVAAPESKFGFTIGDQVKPVSGDASYVNEHYSAHFDGRYGKSDGTYFVREFTGTEIGISAKNEGGAACFFFPSRFEAAAPPVKFKVGDRVKIVGNSRGQRHLDNQIGREFTITMRDGLSDEGWSGDPIENDYWWPEMDLQLVSAAPTPVGAAPTDSFIVARLTPTGQPRPNARPRVHPTLDSANQEAARLANRLGDEFAVYQRVSSRTVDAGPVPTRWGMPFDAALAKGWVRYGQGEHPKASTAGLAFEWGQTKQGFGFWSDQCSALTPLGRAILRKWIAEAEAEQPKVAA